MLTNKHGIFIKLYFCKTNSKWFFYKKCVLFLLFWLFISFYLSFYLTGQAQEVITHQQSTTSVSTQPLQPFEICEVAKNAGYLYYGNYLLNPQDFQVLRLQPIVQPYLSRLELTLAAQGTELVTIVLPPRSIIFPELNERSQTAYNQLISNLEQTGLTTIPVATLLETYSEDFFFSYDHHWTPFAARKVAKLVAETIYIDPINQQQYISEEMRYSWSPYNSRLKSMSALCDYATLPNTNSDYSVRATNLTDEIGFLSSWVTTLAVSEGLFDTRTTGFTNPSILLGTSNSESTILNFSGFLSEFTGQATSNYAFSSSGSLGSMLHYFLSEEYLSSKAPYIFWEFLANPHTTDYNLNAIKYYRQIIPSITGPCETTALTQTNYQLTNDTPREYLSLFEREAVLYNIDTPNFYLNFQLSGGFLDRIIVDIQYTNGQVDQSTIALLAPSGGRQKAYLEFLDTRSGSSTSINGQVRSIHLSFPQGSSLDDITNINVDLCHTP